jgi:hypothetical protein
MLAAARVTLRLHRFEIGVAALAAIAAAMLGTWMTFQLGALHVSQGCLDQVHAVQDWSGVDPDCIRLIRAGSEILGESYLDGEGTVPLSIMGALPFLVGLLGGVPIVARETEARTTQTAWSLNASRTRWLGRQIAPIGVVLTIASALAAAAAAGVGVYWVQWGYGGHANLIGLEGPLVLVRTFGAFGIGLAVGALLGRTLPAFIFGVALALALLFALSQARERWLASLAPQVIAEYSEATGEWNPVLGTQPTDWGWLTPEGELISKEQARQVATRAGVPPPHPEDVQDTPAAVWLEHHGYTGVPLGVTDAAALGWAPYDAIAFGAIGAVGIAGAVALVNRRRPT